jgi:hypothetical protein
MKQDNANKLFDLYLQHSNINDYTCIRNSIQDSINDNDTNNSDLMRLNYVNGNNILDEFGNDFNDKYIDKRNYIDNEICNLSNDDPIYFDKYSKSTVNACISEEENKDGLIKTKSNEKETIIHEVKLNNIDKDYIFNNDHDQMDNSLNLITE